MFELRQLAWVHKVWTFGFERQRLAGFIDTASYFHIKSIMLSTHVPTYFFLCIVVADGLHADHWVPAISPFISFSTQKPPNLRDAKCLGIAWVVDRPHGSLGLCGPSPDKLLHPACSALGVGICGGCCPSTCWPWRRTTRLVRERQKGS